MATAEWVESAATRPDNWKPAINPEAVSAQHLLAMPPRSRDPRREAELKALELADARRYARRLANRHGCAGLCDSPEHARDVADALLALEVLFGEPRPRRKGGL